MSPALQPPGPAETKRLLGILRRPAPEAARLLLGQVLVRRLRRRSLAVRIVETEAYLGLEDEAAHAFHGRTARTEPLWGPPGTVYVYFIYGMHHCLNLGVDRRGVPGCVLIRAAEPLGPGLEPLSCRGPGRLCRALGLDTRQSGDYLFAPGSELFLRAGAPPARILTSGRVGTSRASEARLRFYDPTSAAVSSLRPGRAASDRPRRTPPPRK